MRINTEERAQIARESKRILNEGAGTVCSSLDSFDDEFDIYSLGSLKEPLIIRLVPKTENFADIYENYYRASDYWFVVVDFGKLLMMDDSRRFLNKYGKEGIRKLYDSLGKIKQAFIITNGLHS